MPELPEVETTRRGIAPHLVGRVVDDLCVREPRLRWPVDPTIGRRVRGARVTAVERRGKYLLIRFGHGTLLVHLGMSGSIRVIEDGGAPRRHDHVDIVVRDGPRLRFNDPRRFGSIHFATDPAEHPLIAHLGPEPFDSAFDGGYLASCARGRKASIKTLIMNAEVVVGVGNIYANEALFLAGIHPARAAGRISAARLDSLADGIRAVLAAAIDCGGTTLRDFVGGDGRPGYFRQSLRVYEKAGEPCARCRKTIRRRVLSQRATYYCPGCQR